MSYLQKITLIALVLLLFSNVTFAFSVDIHLCQGEFESIAFFGQKASCKKMLEAEEPAPRSCCHARKKLGKVNFSQKSCCDNVQILQDNVLEKTRFHFDSSDDFELDLHENPISTTAIFFSEKIEDKKEIRPPPLIQSELSQESLQVFLI